MTNISLGKAIEHKVASELMIEDYLVYLPTADDHGVDMIAITPAGNLAEVQVKASFTKKQPGLFANINYKHNPASNYFFVFYVASLNKTWILSGNDFLANASLSKSGKNAGKYSIDVCSAACSAFSKSTFRAKII